MAVNRKRLLQIILDKCNQVEERCPGYRKELLETIADILVLESQHRVQGTNIRQKIADKCSALGDILADNRTDM